jgi:integrase
MEEIITKQKKSKKLPVAISQEEFLKLIKATNMDKHKLAFLLGFESGMRISEIVGGKRKDGSIIEPLTADKINLKENSIFISQGKGRKDRIVSLPKHFKENYLKMLPLGIGVRGLEISFKRACKRAGLLETKPTLHFHSLRHGFASHCVKSGVPIHHVRTLMGHSNISTTNVYLEMNPKEAIKSVEDLF